MKILRFDGDHRYLSNFFDAPFVWKGKQWKTTEHAYQAMKATEEWQREYIRNLSSARDAKKEGKKVKIRSDWSAVKDFVMQEIVFEKFLQNKHLAKLLLETGDAIIEEGDIYWGICPPDSGIGENKLGIILMYVREKLKGN
jgi:ribA/ribD-fused uncharacterized protein